MGDYEERARLRIAAQRAALEARYQPDDSAAAGGGAIAGASLEGGAAGAGPPGPRDPTAGGASTDAVIDAFLHGLDVSPPSPAVGSTAAPPGSGGGELPAAARRPGTAPPGRPSAPRSEGPPSLPPAAGAAAAVAAAAEFAAVGPAKALGVQGPGRLAQEAADLQAKVALLSRDKQRLQDLLTERDERIRRMEEDVARIRKDPHLLHPAIQRLRKMGLNTPALAELGERWAGYVMGRISMAMEVGHCAFRSVFANHAVGGYLTEESFKAVVMQFETSIKSDQLTRLWFFADSDGSGRLDLFEYMRLFGCNCNGDMSDEYFDVVVMHMYKKFHARGGVRRVFAAADKRQNQALSPSEWLQFLQSNFGSEVGLTKQELIQIFHRMNVSNSGYLTLAELDAALETAASKCHVSEKWVRETFQTLTVQVQASGLPVRKLISSSTVSNKDFSDFMRRFLPSLRASQLDRLWKFLWTAVPQDQHVRAHGGSQGCIATEGFLSAIFSPTLGALELLAVPGDGSGAGLDAIRRQGKRVNGVAAASSMGVEVVEQVAALLREHMGHNDLAATFDALDPFLTPDHLHDQLTERLGLQYDMVKTKQIFSLIDVDRDGKITRYEFESMFKSLSEGMLNNMTSGSGDKSEDAKDAALKPTVHGRVVSEKTEDSVSRESTTRGVEGKKSGSTDNVNLELQRAQGHRLMNRLYVMERELQQYSSGQGRIFHKGEVVPTVPEKQYEQLCSAHTKVLAMVKVSKHDSSGGRRHHRHQSIASTSASKDGVAPGEERRSSISSPVPSPATPAETGLSSRVPSPRNPWQTAPITGVTSPRCPPLSPLSPPTTPGPQHSPKQEQSAPLSADTVTLQSRCHELEKRLAELEAERDEEANSFKARMHALQVENSGLLARVDEMSVRSVTSQVAGARSPSPQPKAAAGQGPACLRQGVDNAALMLARKRRSASPQQKAQQQPQTVQGVGPVSRVLRQFAAAPCGLKKLSESLAGLVLEDRFRISAVLSISEKTLLAGCQDLFLDRPAMMKIAHDLRGGPALANEACIMSVLAQVSHVPDIFHFSGAFSVLPFSVMELLQGETLAMRLQAVQEGRAAAIGFLEAAELADGLLQGVDQCHQQGALNLGLRPHTVWISPPLSGARVKLLDWELARSFGGRRFLGELGRTSKRGDDVPKFFRVKYDEEISPSKLVNAGNAVERPNPSLMIKGYGALYYMAIEQLYLVVNDFEQRNQVYPTLQWNPSSVGPSAKLDDLVIHWWQKGNGLVTTQNPIIGSSPLGRLFQVEVRKVLAMVKRSPKDLGLRIGLAAAKGLTRAGGHFYHENKDELRDAILDRAWVVGGDCAYYAKGRRLPAEVPGELSEEGGNMGVREEGSNMGGETSQRYLSVGSGLKMNDRVQVLAEWSGDVSVFVNSVQIGLWQKAMEPWEVVQPLYGLVDLHTHEKTEEPHIRSVALSAPSEGRSGPKGMVAERMLNELLSISRLVHMPAATALGPSCDVFACARIIAQLFRGGREVSLPPALQQVQAALAQWVCEKCPLAESRYYLLAAIRQLQVAQEADLAEVGSQAVRCVLARGLKTSRYSRLDSCWEFARMLNEATGWLEMTPDFLRSHVAVAEQAEWRRHIETWYAKNGLGQGESQQQQQQQQQQQKQRRRLSKESSLSSDSDAGGAGDGCTSAVWDVRRFPLGQSHITHMVQVLTEWREPNPIRGVVLSRFVVHIPEELQLKFVKCFFADSEAASVASADVEGGGAQQTPPTLMLEDVTLPTETLPRERFPLAELLDRKILWLVTHFVRDLDLVPEPLGLQGRPVTVGADPTAVPTLAAAIAASRVLARLSLRSSALGEQGGLRLAPAVQQCRSLRYLDLSDNNLGPQAVTKVVQAIEHCGNVTSLDLSRNSFGGAGAHGLVEGLASSTSLRELNLARTDLGLDGAEVLAECIMRNGWLTRLDLTQNDIPLKGAGDVLRATALSRTMKALILDFNQPWPSYEGSEVLAHAFVDPIGCDRAAASQTRLEALSLKRCNIRSTAAVRFFSALSHNVSIRQLNLAWNGMRRTGADELAQALVKAGSALEELDLRDNLLGQQDAFPEALYQVCPQDSYTNRRLRMLHLANNGLTARGASLLGESLIGFEALEELLLYHNAEIGDAGAEGLAKLLAHRTAQGACRLRRLNLAACGIGDPGCRALAAALGRNDTLVALDLSCNGVRRAGAAALGEALTANRILETLNLAMNSLCAAGLRELLRAAAAPPPPPPPSTAEASSPRRGEAGPPRRGEAGSPRRGSVRATSPPPPPPQPPPSGKTSPKAAAASAAVVAAPSLAFLGGSSSGGASAVALREVDVSAQQLDFQDDTPPEAVTMEDLRNDFGERLLAKFKGLPA